MSVKSLQEGNQKQTTGTMPSPQLSPNAVPFVLPINAISLTNGLQTLSGAAGHFDIHHLKISKLASPDEIGQKRARGDGEVGKREVANWSAPMVREGATGSR